MFHDRATNLEASRRHLMSESRIFPNAGFDKLLDDAAPEDLIWLDGALSDQLEALPHCVPDPVQRHEFFVQISDRLALVRRFSEMRAVRRQSLIRQSRLWTVVGMVMVAGAAMAQTVVAGG